MNKSVVKYPQNKLIVEYDPDNGVTLPDNQSQKYVENVIDNMFAIPHIIIGNELLITLFRCAVAEGKIKHTEIEFLFKGQIIKISKYGRCEEWPKGFGDHDINATEILLGLQHKEAVRGAKHRGPKL